MTRGLSLRRTARPLSTARCKSLRWSDVTLVLLILGFGVAIGAFISPLAWTLPHPSAHMHVAVLTPTSPFIEQVESDGQPQSPFVQDLDPDWQSEWFNSRNSSAPYATIADADCLLFPSNATHTRCPLPRTQDDLIHRIDVAYSVCGDAVQDLAITSMKTLILYRHHSVELHIWIIASPYYTQVDFFNRTMQRWPIEHTPHPFNAEAQKVFLHFIDMDAAMVNSTVLRRAEKSLSLFKRCSTTRLWLRELLPLYVGLVAYLDCDTLIIRDYRQMLSHAQLWSPTQLISFAYEGTSLSCGSWYFLRPPNYPAPSPYPINGGVMLVNLTRLRQPDMDRLYTEPVLLLLNMGAAVLAMGDQDVFNRWIGQLQRDGHDLFFPLPFSYNWRECAFVTPGEVGGVTLLHGNGYKFTNGVEEPFWVAIYQSYFLWHKMPSNPTMRIKV